MNLEKSNVENPNRSFLVVYRWAMGKGGGDEQ
jgi:hypothetical protein